MQGISREKIEELVELYRESLINFIYRYVRDPDTAEDLAEDVFVELLIHPDRFRNASSEKTYLFAIGRNKAVDFIRKHSRMVLLGDRDTLTSEDELSFLERESRDEERLKRMAEDNDPATSIIRKEEREHLHRALRTIKKEYREALALVYFEDMTYEEAGRVMGKNNKQVENLIYRGKKSLARALEDMSKAERD